MPVATGPRAGLLLLACAGLAAGCGGPKLYPVEGRVVFTDGKPAAELAGGSVSLESAGGAAARGEIRPDGTFRLGTRGPDDGVVPGEYRAVVVGYTSFLPEKEPRPALAAKYRSFDTSGLTVTVKPVPNQVELVVERPKR